jgi:hypothetical protein
VRWVGSCSIRIPKDSVIEYENAEKADGFLSVARGASDKTGRARENLASENPARLDLHEGAEGTVPDTGEHGNHAVSRTVS